MIQAGLLGAFLLAVLPVRIEAEACPSKADIQQRLETMLSSASSSTAPDVARTFRLGEVLQIELLSGDGALIADRSLPYAGSCAELASIVAVVLASWESDVHPEFARPHADLDRTRAGLQAQIADKPIRPSWVLDVSAGAGLSLADSAAFGGALAMTWFPKNAGLGARLCALGETRHTADVGSGQARWQRWTVGGELDWRAEGKATSLDLHGGVALGILQATGVGFEPNRTDSSLAAGLVLGARFSLWASRRFAVIADVSGSYWGRDQRLRSSLGFDNEVPHFQGLLALGLAARLLARGAGEPESRPAAQPSSTQGLAAVGR
jgi:hypothetical protein